MSFIPYGRQLIDEDDIQAVVDVLREPLITQGPQIEMFEQSLCQYTGARFAIALSSGTAALHLACRALGVKPGDVVWTSPISFAASAACAIYCGAEIEFVDIDSDTHNISVEALSYRLQEAEKHGRTPKVVIVVHFAGRACDMKEVRSLSIRYGFKIIEDACHALGAVYMGETIGGCQYSEATVFSFHPVKCITTGEGGAVMTNNAEIAAQCKSLRHHGIEYTPENFMTKNDREGYHEIQAVGYNYRLCGLNAALGVSQLKKLGAFIQARRAIAEEYFRGLSKLPLKLPLFDRVNENAWHLFVIEVFGDGVRDRVFASLRALGIGVAVHYIPIYRHPAYQRPEVAYKKFPNAEKYYQSCLTLPINLAMTESDIDYVTSAVKLVLSQQSTS
ncbi:MAG: UDP-4-amino-4,6-dideoxy-N-acetyl-beta-L-altrosamine transaminase [Hahellaceae bacterium]|nr:UDP-4-amino-4,6-dideoxy-N-acetyl-beta-L-altrosamine transaminase [Hahellaceae bacterium]MCP5211719.1 UDP-4-amino-4,6-dideoxy-N-acetyl-beta-L-altrosamine transaminase [Hahellaceae bacterium]